MQESKQWIGGKVVKGKGLGRKLGFPTANLKLDHPAYRPADGIYACWVKVADQNLVGALHVGPRPAVGDSTSAVEVHILDFDDQELYNQRVVLKIVERLRNVQNFSSPKELTRAIAEDCERVREILEA